MKIVLLSLLVSVTLAQEIPDPKDYVIDSIHGFRVEYDENNDIIIFVSDRECYIIEVDILDWNELIRKREDLITIIDEIYAQIQVNTRVYTLTPEEAIEEYFDSILEQYLCRGKKLFKVVYTAQVDYN